MHKLQYFTIRQVSQIERCRARCKKKSVLISICGNKMSGVKKTRDGSPGKAPDGVPGGGGVKHIRLKMIPMPC